MSRNNYSFHAKKLEQLSYCLCVLITYKQFLQSNFFMYVMNLLI